MEMDYREWMDRRHTQALDDFETLLRETKIITYKSKQMIAENEQHLKDILAVLEVIFFLFILCFIRYHLRTISAIWC